MCSPTHDIITSKAFRHQLNGTFSSNLLQHAAQRITIIWPIGISTNIGNGHIGHANPRPQPIDRQIHISLGQFSQFSFCFSIIE